MTLQEAIKEERALLKRTAKAFEHLLLAALPERFSWPYQFASQYTEFQASMVEAGFIEAQADKIFWAGIKSFTKKAAAIKNAKANKRAKK